MLRNSRGGNDDAHMFDAQIMPEIDVCTLTVFSGVVTNQNGGITQGRQHGHYLVFGWNTMEMGGHFEVCFKGGSHMVSAQIAKTKHGSLTPALPDGIKIDCWEQAGKILPILCMCVSVKH